MSSINPIPNFGPNLRTSLSAYIGLKYMLRALPGALLNIEGTARASIFSISSSFKHARFTEVILSDAVGTSAHWQWYSHHN
jgi:hypothetical protein